MEFRRPFYRLVGFDPQTMTIRKEITGGITTFLTMAYILAVHPAILSATGMDQGAIFTTTVITSIIGTVLMALLAKMPFAQAPGMGLNAFFAYTIVLAMGYTWQFALTAVLIEGLLFIALSITGLRERLVQAMPLCIRSAIAPGIGLFIAFIGMNNAGIVVSNSATLVSLGDIHSVDVLLAMAGVLLCAILTIRKVPGALLLGIIITAAAGIPLGVTHINAITDTPPSISPILFQFQWDNIFTADMVICIFTLFFLDMFDTAGTLIGVSTRAGMIDSEGRMPRMKEAFLADAIATTAGAMLGTSTVSTFVESAAGVEAGGRSGMTSLVTAACFLVALFFAPIFIAIPAAATAPALILVGVIMMQDIRNIDFKDLKTCVPAFICMAVMPFTSSISDGILLGVISYVLIHLLSGHYRQLSIGSIILALLFMLKFALL